MASLGSDERGLEHPHGRILTLSHARVSLLRIVDREFGAVIPMSVALAAELRARGDEVE